MAAATQPLLENTKRQVPVSLGGERTHGSMLSLLKKATKQCEALQNTGSSLRLLSMVRSLPVEPNKTPPPPTPHRGNTPPGAQSPLTHYRQKHQQCLPATLYAENSPTKQRFLNFSTKINWVQFPEATQTNAEQFEIRISSHQPKPHHTQTTSPFKRYRIKLEAHTPI